MVLNDVRRQRVGAFEAVRQHQIDVAEDVAGYAMGHDLAGIQQHDALADLQDELQIVGGHHDRLGRCLEELDKAPSRADVQIGGGLVIDHQLGAHGQHAGD